MNANLQKLYLIFSYCYYERTCQSCGNYELSRVDKELSRIDNELSRVHNELSRVWYFLMHFHLMRATTTSLFAVIKS